MPEKGGYSGEDVCYEGNDNTYRDNLGNIWKSDLSPYHGKAI